MGAFPICRKVTPTSFVTLWCLPQAFSRSPCKIGSVSLFEVTCLWGWFKGKPLRNRHVLFGVHVENPHVRECLGMSGLSNWTKHRRVYLILCLWQIILIFRHPYFENPKTGTLFEEKQMSQRMVGITPQKGESLYQKIEY